VQEELRILITSYQDSRIGLAHLAQHLELLIEQMQPSLSANTFSRAMNRAYLIEDINALVQDECRQVTEAELDDVNANLLMLQNMFATK
jgi:hypothetical protein